MAEAKESYMVVGRCLRPASCRKWHARFREMERETEHDERPGRSNRLDSRLRDSPPRVAIENSVPPIREATAPKLAEKKPIAIG